MQGQQNVNIEDNLIEISYYGKSVHIVGLSHICVKVQLYKFCVL